MTPRAGVLLLACSSALATPLATPAGAVDHVSTHQVGTERDERLVGSGRGDWIEARRGDDVVIGRGGGDNLSGDDGQDQVSGGPGRDELYGGRGADLVGGGPGDDALQGDRGRDVLRGGGGQDFLADYDDGDLLLGGSGDDRAAILSEDPGTRAVTRLHLGPGDDVVMVNDDQQVDLVDCGPGHDVAEWVTTLDPHDHYVGCEVVQEYLGP